jgi:enamine deaminase RidA (YjgF/YER057c/UK114 family)
VTSTVSFASRRQPIALSLGAIALLLGVSACGPKTTEAPAEQQAVQRYPIPNSTFPIARAVEVPASKVLVFPSGTTPDPANPEAEKFSAEYWGDTKAQTISVLTKTKATLESLGLGLGDVVKMTAYVVGPAPGAPMDFAGFMEGYTQFFGTAEQPKLPARTTVQVAGLAAQGMLVEIEVIVARP